MIIALENNSERTLAEFLSNFPTVSYVLVDSGDILIAFSVEPVIGLVVEHAHI